MKWFLSAVILLLFAGCAQSVTDPAVAPVAASCSTNKDLNGLHLTFVRWGPDLQVMFVDDLEGSSYARGSSEGHQYRYQATIRPPQGPALNWEMVSRDGRTARLVINDQNYDLKAGRLFAVRLVEDQITVKQFTRDMSELPCEIPKCTQFVNDDQELLQHFELAETGSTPTGAPNAEATEAD